MDKVQEPTVVRLDRGDYTTLTVNLKGGTVTSWRIENKEQLFLSTIATLSGIRTIYGGICFAFPHFGPWEFGPKYGVTRSVLWQLEEGPKVMNDVGDVYAKFSICDDAYTHSLRSFRFKLSYVVVLLETAINFDVKVENRDHFYLDFTFVMSALFLVDQKETCKIIGMEGVTFNKLIDQEVIEGVETENMFAPIDALDKLYLDPINDIYLTNIKDPGIMRVNLNDFGDVFFADPVEETTKNPAVLRKMQKEDLSKFILINSGYVRDSFRLYPNGIWNFGLTYQHVKPIDEPRIHDIFEGYC